MTSYQIAAHVGREVHPSYLADTNGTTRTTTATTTEADADPFPPRPAATSSSSLEVNYKPSCVFCRIVRKEQNAYVVWEDEKTLAFLDLMPIRSGHTLLIPKTHCPRISDLDPRIGASIGAAIPQITTAITKATGNDDLNCVLNQGYAQAVHHAHFHLIPAPHPSNTLTPPPAPSSTTSRRDRKVSEWTAAELQRNPPSHREMLRGETEARNGYLSERDGLEMSQRIRSCL